MRNYVYEIVRTADGFCQVCEMSGTFQAENSHDAWQHVMGLLIFDGKWNCKLWNGSRFMGDRVFIRGKEEIVKRAAELAAKL